MTGAKTEIRLHPTDVEMADYLSNSLSGSEKERLTDHIAICRDCLEKAVSAYESVKLFKRKVKPMKKVNLYIVLLAASFLLSFVMPRYFLQFLVATLLFGIKWIVDSKSTKMLVMIYEAWKKGGEKEASRILESLDSEPKKRF